MTTDWAAWGIEPGLWDELAEQSDNIFATRAWAEAWWRHYGTGAPMPLTDDADAPRVLLPLHRRGRVLRQAKLVGFAHADELGPVSDRADRSLVRTALRRAVSAGELKADVLLLQDVLVQDEWWSGLGGRTVRYVPSPSVEFGPGGWEQYLAGRSRNTRSNIKRKERKLRQDHESVVIRAATPLSWRDDLATLFRLHDARWGGSSPFTEPANRAFVEDFAEAAVAAGWLRLYVLEVDGRAAAAQLDFRFGGAEGNYQSGRDLAFESYSPGYALMVHAMREAASDGLKEFRFWRGDEDYKFRFATGTRDVHTVAIPLTLRGRAAVAVLERRARAAADATASVRSPAGDGS